MLAERTVIAANGSAELSRRAVERAAYWGWEDATLGESMRASLWWVVDSPLWWVYVGAYKRTKAELGEDLDGCEFELLPEWQREDYIGD